MTAAITTAACNTDDSSDIIGRLRRVKCHVDTRGWARVKPPGKTGDYGPYNRQRTILETTAEGEWRPGREVHGNVGVGTVRVRRIIACPP